MTVIDAVKVLGAVPRVGPSVQQLKTLSRC